MARERVEWPGYVPQSTREGRRVIRDRAKSLGVSLVELAERYLESEWFIMAKTALDAETKLDPAIKFEMVGDILGKMSQFKRRLYKTCGLKRYQTEAEEYKKHALELKAISERLKAGE